MPCNFISTNKWKFNGIQYSNEVAKVKHYFVFVCIFALLRHMGEDTIDTITDITLCMRFGSCFFPAKNEFNEKL